MNRKADQLELAGSQHDNVLMESLTGTIVPEIEAEQVEAEFSLRDLLEYAEWQFKAANVDTSPRASVLIETEFREFGADAARRLVDTLLVSLAGVRKMRRRGHPVVGLKDHGYWTERAGNLAVNHG